MDEATFRAVMGRFATGVAVVAVRTAAGLHGVTVNAFTSVSLKPVLVLVSLDSLSTSCALVAEAGRFAVSVLSDRHEFLADRFAGRAPLVPPDFTGAPHTLTPSGHPILDGCLAWLDCRVHATHEAGDHTLVVAAVEALGLGTDDPPLLYWTGRFRHLGSRADGMI